MDRVAYNAITAILDRGESVQVVGIPGSGVSRLGLALTGSDSLLLNVNLLTPLDADSLVTYVRSVSPGDLVVIDSIDRMLDPSLTPFFNFLKAWRDQHKYHLRIVFLNHTAIPIPVAHQETLGDLFSLLSENIYFVQPITREDFAGRITGDFSAQLGYSPTARELKEIYSLSGGIPALVKILIQAARDGQSSNPVANSRLRGQLEEIRKALGDNPSPEQLRNHGLVDTSGKMVSLLLEKFMDQYSPAELSAAETRLFQLLEVRQGQVVSKDDICTAVYPDVKNRAGISDHAIDQLIHRLREKIKNRYSLTTCRGLGYVLIPA